MGKIDFTSAEAQLHRVFMQQPACRTPVANIYQHIVCQSQATSWGCVCLDLVKRPLDGQCLCSGLLTICTVRLASDPSTGHQPGLGPVLRCMSGLLVPGG